MPMTLYFKRAKCFVSNDDKGTKKFLAQPGPAPQPVPFWVAATPTFHQGIKDKSIINLTPPEQMPGYKPAAVAVVEPEEVLVETETDAEPADEVTTTEDVEEDVEQTDLPEAPFGGQPMTPVSPAPKVGSVRATSRRR